MASIQEAEIQFAQRLASNEKPIRSNAIKRLRKYITVRSQKIKGGFTGEELLKLWKGLFYCLWMQDKPLLQEELSNQISGLLHNFQNVDSQFLFLESFLQTLKREWTGIDRLRMDKFFQLVRFVFRQAFEMLRRRKWETSLVGRFLELLTAQVLQSSSAAPCGLQLHILDLYMTELAAVGSAELTADQSQSFIEPFCKTAAKTKDRVLLKAICGSIFMAIVDQAPFAIEDLMREVKGGPEDSDSGQASDDDEEEDKEMTKTKPSSKRSPVKTSGKQINGTKSNEGDDDDEEDDDDDEDDDELLQLEDDSDSEVPGDSEVGPILQFDYGALANKLFELASRNHTPSHNREKLYRIVKIMRDLSEGIFPQDEYPEEVSTDEDDDEMFGSRKRMKRGRGRGEDEDEEGGPAAKKRKGKKKEGKPGKANEAKDDDEPAESTGDTKKKRKKRKKKKKKAGEGTSAGGEEHTEGSREVKATVMVSFVETGTEESAVKDTETVPEPTEAKTEQSPLVDSTEAGGEEEKMETSPSVPEEKASSIKVTAEVSPTETEVQSQTPQPSEEAAESQTSVTVTEAPSQPEPQPTEEPQKDQLESSSTKNTEVDPDVSEPSVEVSKAGGEQPISVAQEGDAIVGGTEQETTPETDTTTATTTPAKRKSKRKSLKVERKAEEVGGEAAKTTVDLTLKPTPTEEPENLEVSEAGVAGMDANGEDPVFVSQEVDAEAPAAEPEVTLETDTTTTTTTPAKKKSKRKSLKVEKKVEAEGEAQVEVVGGVTVDLTTTDDSTTALPKKKTKNKKGKGEVDLTQEEEAVMTVDLTREATPSEEPANSEVSQSNVDIMEAGGEQAAAAAAADPQGDVVVVEDEPETTPQTDATTTPARKTKRKSLKIKKKAEEVEGDAQVTVDGESMEAVLASTSCEKVVEDADATPLKKKTKKKKGKQEVDLTQEEETVDLTLEATPAEGPANSEISEPGVDAKAASETDSTTTPAKRKSKRKSLKPEKDPEEVEKEAKVEDVDLTSVDCETSVEDTDTLKKTKNKKCKREKETTQEEETKTIADLTLGATPVEEPSADDSTTTLLKKKKKKKIQKAAGTEEPIEVGVEETPSEVDAKDLLSEIAMVTPVGKKKKKPKAAAFQESQVEGQTQSEEAGVAVGETPAEESHPESAGLPSSEKKAKKKRKIPVVFEFEADELAAAEEATMINGLAEEETTAKRAKLSSEPSTPLSTKKSPKKKKKAKAESGSDFITFQSNTSIPMPLFCKAMGGTSTPLSSKKKFHTPKSESKKVTFGLKNNKTAEFRKTDQSLLVSPDGSSRVPFDPKQKPKFGVLKSPVRSLTGSVKKTPKTAKPPKSQKTTPKGRPTAADFF